MSDAVRFLFRGQVRSLHEVPPARSVLHWLREDEHATGTKEGCNQGDCGACTVVLADLRDGRAVLTTANACLLPVAALHGRALFTIEDVSAAGLHPVQQAMIDAGGSQCGFCTPGFVMSLWHLAEQSHATGTAPERSEVADALSGNLCRCTGYRPILDAAMTSLPTHSPQIDLESLAAALAELNDDDDLRLAGESGTYLAPVSEAGLAGTLAAHPDAVLMAGGTDLMPAMHLTRSDSRDDLVVVSTARIASLRRISADHEELVLGSAVSLEDAWQELVARLPHLHRMHRRFAGPAIRSAGTIGGNIANASPIADLVPVLQVLDAEVEITGARGSRREPVTAFAIGVRRTVLEPGEFIARIVIPMPAFTRDVRSHKVSRRFDDDISTVSATLGLRLDDHIVSEVRVVMGGLATTVRRAEHVEQSILGRVWDDDALAAAQAALAEDYSPISDHRATADYRLSAARGLLHRWWLETSPVAPDVPSDVWARS